jgi:hypothetical protein
VSLLLSSLLWLVEVVIALKTSDVVGARAIQPSYSDIDISAPDMAQAVCALIRPAPSSRRRPGQNRFSFD